MTLQGGALFARKAIDTAPSISMLQGLRYRRFALGAGMGYDVYKDWRAMPLFTGVSYDFVHDAGQALYVQMNGGYSKAWFTRSDEAQPIDKSAGGYFFHPAVGYRAGKGRASIHISVGYKIQHVQYDATPLWWGGWNRPRVTITQTMERVSFLIGIGLR